MTADSQKEATKIFGPLLSSETFLDHLNNDPEVEMVVNDQNTRPIGTAKWHADMTWTKEPPGGTSLYARVLPDVGGDTIWASMTAAYDYLSDKMKAFLEGLKVVHTWDKAFPGRQIVLQRGVEFYLNHKFSNPPIKQPLIRTLPRTKMKIVNVNPAFSSYIIGLPPQESEGVLSFLFTLPTRSEFQ